MLKKGDIVLVALVLAVGLLGYGAFKYFNSANGGTQRIAVIKQDNKIVKKINLDEVQKAERIDVSSDFREIIRVEKGRIRFEEADCPDQICVETGWLTEKGDTAVCLPNRTVIRIEGEGEAVDGGTY